MKISITNFKDILVSLSIIVGCIFYFSPRNSFTYELEYFRAILFSLSYELLIIVVLSLIYLYRKNIKAFLKRHHLYFEHYVNSSIYSIIIYIIIISGFLILTQRHFKNLIVNRLFFYSNILEKKFYDDLVNEAVYYEKIGDFRKSSKIYSKLSNLTDERRLKRLFSKKIEFMDHRMKFSDNLIQRIYKDSITRKYDVIEVAQAMHAFNLDPKNNFKEKIINEIKQNIRKSIGECCDIIATPISDKHKFKTSIEPYIWLFYSNYALNKESLTDEDYNALINSIKDWNYSTCSEELSLKWFLYAN